MESANNWVKVHFFRQKKVYYGEAVYVCGSIPALGDWNPYKALKLNWSEGDNWEGEIYLQTPCDFEYKYITSCSDQGWMHFVNWEAGPNAKMSLFPKDPNQSGNGSNNDINVMSFNIRFDTPIDGENSWEHRKDMVTNLIKVNGCDFVGIQEALFHQTTYLQHMLPTYNWYGRGRKEGSEQSEAVPIFYLCDKWEILEANTFWLSDLPEYAGSKTYGNKIPRICTWAKFRNKANGRYVLVYNCHLDHENHTAQVKAAEQIKKHIAKKCHDTPHIILMGDHNVTPDDQVFKIQTENEVKLKDTFIPKEKEHQGTFHQWSGVSEKFRIDYIFVSEDFKTKEFKIVRDNFKNKYPSDHFPIIAKISI